MGEGCDERSTKQGDTETHHVAIGTQEDRGGTKGAVAEVEGAAEEGCLDRLHCRVGGRRRYAVIQRRIEVLTDYEKYQVYCEIAAQRYPCT